MLAVIDVADVVTREIKSSIDVGHPIQICIGATTSQPSRFNLGGGYM